MKRILSIGIIGLLGVMSIPSHAIAQQINPMSRAALDSLVYPTVMAGADKVLKFSTTVCNMGTVEETHPEISLHYPFRNVSADTVRITRIRTLCGCTQSDDFPRTLIPGEEDSITIRFLPLGKLGKIHQRAYIYTDVSTKPVVCLEIIGRVTEK